MAMENLIFHDLTEDFDNDDAIQPIFSILNNLNKQESVCGIDQRKKIIETNLMPYKAICKLQMKTDIGSFMGTGFLISKNKLVTAGHCVYSHRSGGWKNSIKVIPAMSGFSKPFGEYSAVSLAATKGWIEGASPRYDMGLIKLDRDVTHDDFFKLSADDSSRGAVTGYPGDRDRGMFQYAMEEILSKRGGQFEYMLDTFGGQSGSPLIKSRDTAIGIHNYGGCPNKASDFYDFFIKEAMTW